MKQKLALFLAVLLVFMAIPATAAFTDTVGTPSETAVGVLSALGIVEGKTETAYEPESSLTRAEMVTIILRALHVTVGESGVAPFVDITSAHWAYPYINAAAGMSIVQGVTADTFAPDAPVTYEQGVKMLVAALGYTAHAEAMGGYPGGYLAKASQLNLLKNTSAEGESLTRGTMAILVYNALDIPLMERVSYGSDAYTFKAEENATLLSAYLHVQKRTAYVAAIPAVHLTTPSRKLATNEALLSDGTYIMTGTTDVQNIVGLKADFYTQTDDIGNEVLLTYVPYNNSTMTVINAADIDRATTASVTYSDSENTEQTISITGAALYVNGVEKTPFTADDLTPDMGTVRFIQNGGSVNYILVEAYKNFVVEAKNSLEYTLHFMEAVDGVSSMRIDPNDTATVFITTEGKPATIDDCAKWSVISVLPGAAQTRIYLCGNMISGTITEIDADSATIGEDTYVISHSLQSATTLRKPEISQSAAYYLDVANSIAAVDTASDRSEKYGWLVNIDKGKGISNEVLFKVFTGDGEMKIFATGDKLMLNGVSMRTDTLATTANVLYFVGAPKPQLIRFRTNADATRITEVTTAKNLTAATDDDKIGYDAFNWAYYLNNARNLVSVDSTGIESVPIANGLTYVGGTVRSFFSRIIPRDKTQIFVIPINTEIDAEYALKSPGSLMHGASGEVYSKLSFYDIGEDMVPGAMVWQKSSDIPAYPDYNAGTFGLVTGISDSISEDGEVLRNLTLFTSAGATQHIIDKNNYACLYKSANSDIDADEDWYTEIKGGVKVREIPGKMKNRGDMYIALEDIHLGDVLQYTVDVNFTPAVVNVLYRHDTPGLVEFCTLSGAMRLTSDLNYYMGGLLAGNATVKSVSEYGVVAQAKLSHYDGRPKTGDGTTVLRTYPTTGMFALWDSEKQTIKKITYADLVEGDEILVLWRTYTQHMLIAFR